MNLNLVTIIGAGTMGRGIAQWFAQQGVATQMTDANVSALETGLGNVHASWDKLQNKGKFTLEQVCDFKSKLSIKELSEISPEADLVIEAIVENLEIKHKVFSDLDSRMSEATILASNTSSIPITDLAACLCEARKKKFVGLHFFNPATIMKLVEVIKGNETEQSLCDNLESWFTAKGKKPAQCKDSPGFIVNRVARNFYGEAFRISEESCHQSESFSEIDKVMREVGGFRMGPYELMDLIGIDINYDVTCSVWDAFKKEDRFAPHAIQKQMVDSKKIGRKSGEGFYKYE